MVLTVAGMQPLSPMAPTVQAAWARVSILLNRGLVTEAEAAAVEASAATNWSRDLDDYLQYGGPRVYDAPELPTGWCWVEPGNYRVLISTDAHEEFRGTVPMTGFVLTVANSMNGPGFRSFDTGSWRILSS